MFLRRDLFLTQRDAPGAWLVWDGISCGKLAAVLSYKFVAGAGNRDDQFGPLRILFQLLPKAGNMSIHRSRERIRHIAPNRLQQLLAWNRCSRAFNEVAEKLKFATRQIDWLSVSRNFGSLHVHNDRGKLVDGLPRFYRYAAQQSFDPSDEFGGLKRLGHVIVRAKF